MPDVVRPAARLTALRRLLRDEGLDAILVTHLPNLAYLCGFSGSAGRLLVSATEAFLLVDGRYLRQALEEAPGCSVVPVGPAGFNPPTVEAIRLSEARRVGFESGWLSFWDHGRLEVLLGRSVGLVPSGGQLEALRRRKDEHEIACLRRAGQITAQALERVLEDDLVGLSEAELAARIEYELRRESAEAPAFETLVASGAASVRLHARPQARPIASGQPLLVDAGARFGGYRADMSRTVCPGRASRRFERLHAAVLEAHAAVLAALRPGAIPAELDALARCELARHGLARAFVHGLGHGVGLESHEDPWLVAGEIEPLEAGMVVAIEPGVYLEGVGGIRHEDTVLVTPTGCEVLTRATSRPQAAGVLS